MSRLIHVNQTQLPHFLHQLHPGISLHIQPLIRLRTSQQCLLWLWLSQNSSPKRDFVSYVWLKRSYQQRGPPHQCQRSTCSLTLPSTLATWPSRMMLLFLEVKALCGSYLRKRANNVEISSQTVHCYFCLLLCSPFDVAEPGGRIGVLWFCRTKLIGQRILKQFLRRTKIWFYALW